MIVSGPTKGSAGITVEMVAGQSAVTEMWSSSPLKLLTPRFRGGSVWAYLSSFGGGFVAGDETSVDVRLGPSARCFLTTQASTKVYRNPRQRPCGHRVCATLGPGSLLILGPDPVQSFADSYYAQRQEFHLESGAGLVLLDWFTSGRAACGERWRFHRLWSRNDIYIDGERRLLDSMLLDSAHGPMAGAHRLGRFNRVAMVAIVGDFLRAEAREVLARVSGQPVVSRGGMVSCASPIQGGVVLRIAGERHREVARHVFDLLAFAGGLLGDDPWARK
jgi:urease accessory protein